MIGWLKFVNIISLLLFYSSCLLAIVSVALFIFSITQSDIAYAVIVKGSYVYNLSVSLVLVLFWGRVRSFKDESKSNVILVFLSIIVGLYLIEFLLYSIRPYNFESRESVASTMGVVFDKRTRFEVYSDMKKEGINVAPYVSASNFINSNRQNQSELPFPLGGISKKVTIFCNENGKYAIYDSDRYGFNNPDDEWDSSKVNWVLIGDSFVQGACVDPDDSITSRIRFLTDDSAISLGGGGTGPLIQLGTLREYLPLVTPEHILWFYYEGNDLSKNLSKEKESKLLLRYLDPTFSQTLNLKQTEIDGQLNAYVIKEEMKQIVSRDQGSNKFIKIADDSLYTLKEKTSFLRLFDLRYKIGMVNTGDKGIRNVKVDPLFKKILSMAKEQISRTGGRLYFVYLPSFERYKEKRNHNTYNKRREIIRVAEGLNIPIIDIHQELFEDHPDPYSIFPFRTHGHYTPDAYNRVSEIIINKILINESIRQ